MHAADALFGLTFVTSNAGKAREAAAHLGRAVTAHPLDVPEIQSLDFAEVARAKALVALAETDPRGPSYVVDRARLSDNDTMAALAASIEADIADLYIQAFGDVVKAGAPADTLSERAWLLSSAYDALADSLSWGDPAPDSVAAFPGVSVGADTP